VSNPILAGFHPDPSIVRGADAWYLVTSTFEYLPALPVYRSIDLREWQPIGHVVTHTEQLDLSSSPTPGGVWAPTIRYRDGLYYVIVSVMFPARCILFTSADPSGPWSAPCDLPAVTGIDPDLAWDAEGIALVSFAGFGQGIRQVPVDLTTGKSLGGAVDLWSGTGLHAPEGPHLYRRGVWWYLLVAEGGTERGHAISVARGRSPSGPFEGYEGNPVLSARSTANPVQNVGHADLVETPSGSTAMVLLGVRPLGFSRSFSPLGRETFLTLVDWVDDWPIPRPVEAIAATAESVLVEFTDSRVLEDAAWLAVRRAPRDVGTVHAQTGCLAIHSDGRGFFDSLPAFIGQRQRHYIFIMTVVVDSSNGTGGIAGRYRETEWFALEAASNPRGTTVTAIATLSGLQQRWQHHFARGEVELRMESTMPMGMRPGGDRIHLIATQGDTVVQLVELDGRHWSFETTETFTGRVIGMYAAAGEVRFAQFGYRGQATGGS
jgi:xylan 1,4-beta-xylosidase